MRALSFLVVFLSSTIALAQVSMGGKRITNLGTPTTATDAATKAYADSIAGGGSGITQLTGPVTATGPGVVASTITDGAVTLGKIADQASNTILGNNTGGALSPIAMTMAQLRAILGLSASDVSGLSALATSTDAAGLSGTVACNRLPTFTGGDVNSSGSTCLLTLGTTGVGAATYGSATAVGVCAVNAKGLITSCTNTSISIPATAISDSTATGRALMIAASAAAARTTLALVPGTDVQTQDNELQAIAGTTAAADRVPYFTGASTASVATFTNKGREVAGAADEAAVRAAAGLGTMATQNSNTLTVTGVTQLDGVPAPTVGSSAANRDYVDGVASGIQYKAQVRACTTANGTLATAYENGDTVDTLTLSTGDRILLKDQTTQTENGGYTVNASGAPTRSTDMDAGSELVGAQVQCAAGGNVGKVFSQTTPAVIILGVSNIVWVNSFSLGGAALVANNLSDLTNATTAKTNLGLDDVATSGSAADLQTGALPAARMPAMTGDATSTIGTVALTIPNGTVTLAKQANLAANSIQGNNTGSAAIPLALTAAQVRTLLAMPTLTTKGDLYTFSTVETRLGVGADGLCLKALNSAGTGLEWGTCAAGGSGLSHGEVIGRMALGGF